MKDRSSPFFKGISEKVGVIDAGLRAHMLKVYNYMGFGLAVTGAVAYIASTSAALMNFIFATPGVALILALAPLAICFYLSFRISKIEASTAQSLFWGFAVTMGISMSSLFIVYTGESIASTFFITATMFLSMSIYGYSTGADLSKFGAYLFMGLIGIILASLVNLFMKNSMLQLVISVIGVIIFTGLTAYDTQNIKNIYLESDSAEIADKKAVIGALSLYLDFVNLFLYILRLVGSRRD